MMTRKLRKSVGLTAFASVAFLPLVGFDACQQVQLETQTYELQYLNPDEAAEMIAPYVYRDREGASGVVTSFSNGVTVRETRDNLLRIQEVLAYYDVAMPGVRLHFQIIEANGHSDQDPRIQEVRGVLEELFRFDGYRLVAEPQMAAMEGTGSTQTVIPNDIRLPGGVPFTLQAHVEQIRGRGDKGSVRLTVMLQDYRDRIHTSMAVPVGKTMVLGSSTLGVGEVDNLDRSTIILTVRPEFVEVP